MKILVHEAQLGQVLLTDVISPRGQFIAARGTQVTPQLIQRLAHYRIREIEVVELPNTQPVVQAVQQAPQATTVSEFSEEQEAFLSETASYQIKNSPEFKDFKRRYENIRDSVKYRLTDYVLGKDPLNSDRLLEETRGLYDKNSTCLGTINYLLNMRDIDDTTFAHSMNVSMLSRIIGEWCGITGEELDILTMCGLLHDMGKAMIPSEVLNKPGKLTDEEFKTIRNHPLYGYEILKNEDLDPRIKLAALQHHEKYDGSGYPLHLTGEKMEPFSQIVTIADIYDAMTADRCYRSGVCPFEVLQEFMSDRSNAYNPEFLTVFMDRIAMSYVGAGIRLSDDKIGKVMMINTKDITHPLVQLENGGFCDLSKDKSVTIKSVL